MDKKVIIGYGTGRCGTRSLAQFLSQQGPEITHEGVPLGWYPVTTTPHIVTEFLSNFEHSDIIGDVGYYWVQWLGFVIPVIPNVYAINIHRETDEVVESFWNMVRSQHRVDRAGLSTWEAYPFDSQAATKDAIVTAISRYRMMERMARKMYYQQTYVLPMEALNDSGELEKLLEWLGMPVVDLTPVHTNKSKDLLSEERPASIGRLINNLRRSKED